MPRNRKKNHRSKAAPQDQAETARPPKTVACPRCNKAIIVPKACKHGKKLINCQGTGCGTAHLVEHDASCQPLNPPKPANPSLGQPRSSHETATAPTLPLVTLTMPDVSPAHSAWILGPPKSQVADLSKTFPANHLIAMQELSEQLRSVKECRNKQPRYVQGIPIDEWLERLEKESAAEVNQWTRKFKDLVEGKETAEAIGYDDEDSEDEGDGCLTPTEDE
ncbi:hypothetical protein AYO20_09931 [Fonsecaea nubica]|uniref:Uncharacterized protein n=1 Tax=Fonsecaea nubica TaxID=856822 RepID=A0A178CAA3_9EURO|nr:hypothetical protein AYO20_09931 [Fonsecaea nubica]OAL26898.1 hypothetical protein AYO20_09931 [Fonsecaea nubica]